MNNQSQKQPNQETCTTCFRIQCKKCQWIASEKDVIAIQQGQITACPLCGWQPGDKTN